MSSLGAPLSAPAEEYLSWLAVERGRATNTISAYRRDLVHYEAALADTGRTSLDAGQEDVERYVAGLRSGARSAASVARAISSLRGLHRFLLEEGARDEDPTADLETGRLPARLPKALPEGDVTRVIEGVTGDDPASRRDRALLELLYGTGARVSEAVGLNLADLAGGDGLVRLYGKGSKERLVPLGRHAAHSLARWLEPGVRDALCPERWRRKGDSEAVFLNTRGGRLSRQGAFAVVRDRGRAAGIELAPHALRHSCATHLLAHGADVRVVQELLGHASVTTTQLYTKVTSDHLRAAYDAAHPRAGL
ncbi:MAG TPA: site-specific tyrosine recombinase XerD [Acidimicrobiales bacterium]|nr:site-specific tyrosine recombinase XerD [Acidimicrobiales bacterium]